MSIVSLVFIKLDTEMYSENCKKPKMELFPKIVNDWLRDGWFFFFIKENFLLKQILIYFCQSYNIRPHIEVINCKKLYNGSCK